MRALFAVLGAFAAFLAVLAVLPGVEATTTCHATGNWCQGYAHASTTTGGVASARCFALRATNSAPTCSTSGITPSNEASWEINPGACMNVYWFDTTVGGVPPAAPNKVTIAVYFDSLTATPKITFLNAGAEPANGSSYSVCNTDNILSSGAARSGTLRLFIRPVKDNGAGGVGNYDISSDGAATVGANVGFDKGAIRGLAYVSSITRSAYPSGSMFAYGAGGDESMTITATMTAPNGDDNAENIRNFIADDATLVTYGANGASVDLETGSPSLAQSFTVDSTFPSVGSPYVGGVSILGNSKLTALKWTAFPASGHGAGLTRFSDIAVYLAANFNVNPDIAFDSDGSGTFAAADGDVIAKTGSSSGAVINVANRGETVYFEWYLFNARSEKLTRSMTFPNEDATPTTCSAGGSLTPTGAGLYSTTGAIPTSDACSAPATEAGANRYYRATNTDQSKRATEPSIAVSSLYFLDSHIQGGSALNQDDFPTEDATEHLAYEIRGNGMGGDMSDIIHQWCHVKGVRKDLNIDTTGSAVTRTIKDPTTATRATSTTDTGSDGWTATSQDLLSSTPLGDDWTALCSVSFSGNTGTDTETFEVFVNTTGGADVFQADPLKIYAAYDPVDGLIRAVISASYLDGTARVGAANEINVTVWDTLLGVVVAYDNPIELGLGAYYYNYTPTTGGIFTVRANTTDPNNGDAIGTANDVLVRGNNTLELSTMTNFSGLGFDGFLLVLFWVAAALFFLYRDWAFSLAFTIPGLLDTLFPDDIPGEFAQYLLLAFLGVIMQYFVGDRQRFSLHGKKKTGA